MSKKTTDWRKLVSKAVSHPPHIVQPITAMRRTFVIGTVKVAHRTVGARLFYAYDYAAFMALVEQVQKIHALNPDILISNSPDGLCATVHGEETPQELRARLRMRLKAIKMDLRCAAHRESLASGHVAELTAKAEQMRVALSKAPKTRKARPKKK